MPTPAPVAALALVVTTSDGPPLVHVTGTADRETGRAADAGTPFHLCSAAKAVTAVGVLRLADRGVLDLDADVRDLVPVDVPGRVGPTLRQLLGHRGGVTDPPGSFEPSDGRVPATSDVVAGRTSAHPGPVRVTAEPGTVVDYSDAGYCLVERAVEVATGEAFADVLHREVAVPLGLRATAFWSGETDALGDRGAVVARLHRDAAAGHRRDGGVVPGTRAHYPGPAASSFWSAPEDVAVLLADLGRALGGDDGVLLRADQARAWSEDPDGSGFGLGVFPMGAPGRPCVMTQGWGRGFQSQVRWYPRAGGAAAVLVNHDPGVPQESSPVGAALVAEVEARGWR